MIVSAIFASNAPFAAFGPIMARKLVSSGLGWRYCYYINIACVGLAVVLLFIFYKPPTFDLLHERKTKRQLMKQLDYAGIFLWTAGLTVFLMGISW